ncbi:MAG: DUF2157 domain-containing protein [Steroidobacteraceae bacterium]
MSGGWQAALERWSKAGLLDAAAAARIRAWEEEHGGEAGRSRLALIAFAFGALLLTAGVLLFVAAHWDRLAPGGRFALVLAMIAVLHAGGALAARSSAGLSAALHAAGTGALGAGIFLSGQIFHMAEHWPGALMLWSFGAAVGVWLLRQWPQVLWLAVLAPAWLWGEWVEAQPPFGAWRGTSPAAVGAFLFACVYLAASPSGSDARWRRALAWLGAIALIPAAFCLGAAEGWGRFDLPGWERPQIAPFALVIAWTLATVLPVALAWFLRGRDTAWLLVALAWAIVVTQVNTSSDAGELGLYALLALGASGIVLWGMKDQQRLAINVGVLGFAVAVLSFYFSSVFDKLGRAFGLIGIGILFIGGGWLLERMRRRLVGRIARGGA